MRMLLLALRVVCTGGFYASTAYRTGGLVALASFRTEYFGAALPVAVAFLAPAFIAAGYAGMASLVRRLGWRLALATVAILLVAAVGGALAYFGRVGMPGLLGA